MQNQQLNTSQESLPESEARFRQVFEQAPVSMQLLAADGRTVQVNKAWEALWQDPDRDELKQHVLYSGYNVLTDPQLQKKGVTPFLQRAFAGESVKIPHILYDPAELGMLGRPRWVTGFAHPIKDGEGRIREVMLIHEDITDRVEAESALRLSEGRFRQLVTTTSQIVWTADPQGQVIEDSPSWRAFTGQTSAQWKGAGWLDAVHPDDRKQASDAWSDSVAKKRLFNNEIRILRFDGEYRWTSVRAVPLLNEDGSIREWMGAVSDITEQKRIEEALRINEQRLRFVLDSMQQKIFTATAAGNVDYFNPAWMEFTGLSFEAIRDWGWLQFIHPEDVDENIRVWKHSVDTGEAYQLEHRFRRADGEYRWHLSRAVPMRDEAGRILMWIGSNTDIHEVKTVESELAKRLENERRHAVLLSKVAAASRHLHTALSVNEMADILVNEVRDILNVHQAVISLTADENWSQSINAVALSDKYARYRSYDAKTDGSGIYAEVCRTNRAMRFTQDELERHPAWKAFGNHAGEHPPMRGWLAVPLIGRDGKNLGLIQVSDKHQGDFTEEDEAILVQLAAIAATGFENARLYGSLQEQDRRKDEFLAMLAHELRNPLAPISAAASLLSLARLDGAKVRQTSEVISRQVQHMVGLVDDLMDVSRVTRGLIVPDKQDLEIKRIVADAVEQVRPLIESRRHELHLTLSPEPALVLGDYKRLVQILSNLLNNAAKYTPQGGTIHVRMDTSESNVILSVQDNGIGIAPELQPYIFDLFTQAERSSDRSQGGLGIGLALVKSLVDLHGGKLVCLSEGAGKGSQFIVTLPRLVRPEEEPSTNYGTPHPFAATKTLRILVVDDNVDAAQMLAMFLEAAGHEVLVEHKARQAMERACTEMPDVCVLDIGLPEIDGNELARMLRGQPATAEALLIALTGYGQEQDKKKASDAGFDHHLVKPVDADRLLALLEGTRRKKPVLSGAGT